MCTNMILFANIDFFRSLSCSQPPGDHRHRATHGARGHFEVEFTDTDLVCWKFCFDRPHLGMSDSRNTSGKGPRRVRFVIEGLCKMTFFCPSHCLEPFLEELSGKPSIPLEVLATDTPPECSRQLIFLWKGFRKVRLVADKV